MRDAAAVSKRRHRATICGDAPTADKIEREIAVLAELKPTPLRRLWKQAFGTSPPWRASRDLLLRALTYRVQAQAERDLTRRARNRLARLAAANGDDGAPRKSAKPRLEPGTRLIREWRGQVHQVIVTETGYDYRGVHYVSLSVVARAITGTRWSGPLFFGLRDSAPRREPSTDVR